MGNQPSVQNLVFVVLGVALGVAGSSVARSVLETEPVAAVQPGNTAVSSELNRRMVLLEEAIWELNQSIALQVESMSLAFRVEPTGASTQGPEVAPVDGAPTTDRIPIRALPNPEKLDWSEHINSSLARVLVEYGLTPYDRGVDRILPEAARLMREAKAEEMRLMTDLRERRMPDLITSRDPRYPDFDKARSEIQESHRASTEKIGASFREQVRELALK